MVASFRVGGVVTCLMCGALATPIVCGAPPDKDAKADDKLTKLFEERARLADQDFAACEVAYEAGTLALDSLLAATNEFAEAKLELCKTKAERIAVRVKQVEHAKVREGRIMALNGVQAVGGEFDKLVRAGVERVKAEIAMEEEAHGVSPERERIDETLTKLLEERAKLADQAYTECAAGYKQDVITLDSLLAALNELADAKLRLCKTKAERIPVLEKQVERALDIEAEVRALNDVAARGGEVDKLARSGVQRTKAQIELEQEKGEKGDDKLTKLFDERAKLADQAYQTCAVGYEKGTIELGTLLAAIDELADAKLALCKTKSERIAVLERQVERAKKHETAIRVLSDRQVRGGEADKVARAGVDRVKAEIALELEKRDAAGAAR